IVLAMAALAIAGQAGAAVLWDTGAPHVVNFNGSDTYLGFSAGNLGGASTQRWAAIPFRIGGPGAFINQVNVDGFAPAGSEPATVNYIIWNRSGLTAPTSMYAQGVLGAYPGAGGDDPRVSGGDTFLYTFAVPNQLVAAGDYYFTVYGDG